MNGSYKASDLLDFEEKFEFLVALVISRNVLDSTISVTQPFQRKNINILEATSLKNVVLTLRNSIDTLQDKWSGKALALAQELSIKEAKHRIVGKQTKRANTPYKSISEYYKRTFTIPFVDHLNCALQARFNTNTVNVYYELSVVPYKMISLLNNGID